jgi:hypothetical protein
LNWAAVIVCTPFWRARNPDNPRSVAAQNEQSTMRFVPFANSANLVPELKAANTTELNDASVCPKSADSVEKVYFG